MKHEKHLQQHLYGVLYCIDVKIGLLSKKRQGLLEAVEMCIWRRVTKNSMEVEKSGVLWGMWNWNEVEMSEVENLSVLMDNCYFWR